MNLFLTLAFLFFIGSITGWILELFFRRFISTANPERKWINPGFCIGPYLPLYGFGLCFLFLIAYTENFHWIENPFWNSDEWGNIEGIICPRFSFFWALLGAIYYFLIHPHVIGALKWLSHNLAFSFVIGLFFGVFLIDVAYSSQLLLKLKKFAEENNIVVKYEHLKAQIHVFQEKKVQKHHFFFPFHTEHSLAELLKELHESLEERK